MVSRDDIRIAAERIRLHVRRTPVVALDRDGTIVKLELTQHTGSFKPRGAFNFVLSHRVPRAGLIAASGGNHGQAVAYVANRLGVPAEIFVPEVCSPLKRARISSYGARVVVGGAIFNDAQVACTQRAMESGAMMVHPFEAPAVIAGQGTVGLELSEQEPELETLLVAAGGGGLVAGIAAWYRGSVRVVSVEPEQSCCLAAAVRAGQPVDVEVGGSAADSLGARRLGDLAFDIVREHVAVAVTVPEAAIAAAQRELWERLRIVAEPGGATAYAALLNGDYRPEGDERVGVVVCGGNVDLHALPFR